MNNLHLGIVVGFIMFGDFLLHAKVRIDVLQWYDAGSGDSEIWLE